jgi:hypothetical protein
VLGGNRDSIALMIQELVNWNVDKSILGHITSMGADDAYRAMSAQDLYLLRVALPTEARSYFAPDAAEALRNACLRLLAYHEDAWPFDLMHRVSGELLHDVGVDSSGESLSGYQLVDTPSGITLSYCALPTSQLDLDGDADIALYYGRGIEGDMRPGLSFFHRPNGWSTLGTGGTTTSRIFQKGPMNHFFMAPDAELGGALAMVWEYTKS